MKTFAALVIALGATTAAADVSQIEDDATIAVDCAKDKNVNVVGNNNKFTLTGTCASVNISGNNNTVSGTVTKVQISGNENALTLEAVDSILISGNDNKLTYKKPITKKKVGVLNSGNGNKVAKVK